MNLKGQRAGGRACRPRLLLPLDSLGDKRQKAVEAILRGPGQSAEEKHAANRIVKSPRVMAENAAEHAPLARFESPEHRPGFPFFLRGCENLDAIDVADHRPI